MPLLYLLLMYVPAVLVHELGHYGAARLVGATEGLIRFGLPNEPASRIRFGRLTLAVHWGTGLLREIPVCLAKGWPHGKRWPRLLVSLAGPGCSLVLMLLLWDATAATWQTVIGNLLRGRWYMTPVHTWGEALALWSSLLAVVPLIPRVYRSGMASDGLSAWRALAGADLRSQSQ